MIYLEKCRSTGGGVKPSWRLAPGNCFWFVLERRLLAPHIRESPAERGERRFCRGYRTVLKGGFAANSLHMQQKTAKGTVRVTRGMPREHHEWFARLAARLARPAYATTTRTHLNPICNFRWTVFGSETMGYICGAQLGRHPMTSLRNRQQDREWE
jgi:hypothetical protein